MQIYRILSNKASIVDSLLLKDHLHDINLDKIIKKH